MEKQTIKLETERLILRKFKLSDAKDTFESYCSRDIVTKYLRWLPHKSIEDTLKYLTEIVLPKYEQDYTYCWAIELKETGKIIGCVDVHTKDLLTKKCTIGWVLSDEYWSKGIMTEAAQKVVDFMFEEGFIRVQSHHQIGHIASGKVMQKIGMTYEGRLKKYDIDRYGQIIDCEIYAIVKGE